ncbi:hypothetical protein Tco_0117541 [Tanacetum coccineum]
MERELGEGYSFIKKKCFVCGSLSHLIKDCDFYEKKMAREVELKKQRVFNTGNGVAKLVWNNANSVNRANHFVPRPVQLNAVRSNVNTGRTNVNSVRHNVNSVRTNVNTGRSKQPVPTNHTNSFGPVRPQGKFGASAVKTLKQLIIRRAQDQNSNIISGIQILLELIIHSRTWRTKCEVQLQTLMQMLSEEEDEMRELLLYQQQLVAGLKHSEDMHLVSYFKSAVKENSSERSTTLFVSLLLISDEPKKISKSLQDRQFVVEAMQEEYYR